MAKKTPDKPQRSFSVTTDDLNVSVSGSQEKVSQVYQAIQGVMNSIIPNMLSEGGDLAFSLEGSDEDKSDN